MPEKTVCAPDAQDEPKIKNLVLIEDRRDKPYTNQTKKMITRKPTPHQQILTDFARQWEAKTGSKYLINWGKETRFAMTLIEMDLNPDEYQARLSAFFADEKWWEYGRWGFATFVNNINKCIPTPKKEKPKQPTGRLPKIRCVAHDIDHDPFQLCPACQKENEEIRQ